MRRRRRWPALALCLAALAGASCGDAAFDLLPAEVRAQGGMGGASATGGAAGSQDVDGGSAGAAAAGGQGGDRAPPVDDVEPCAPWDTLCAPCESDEHCGYPVPYCELSLHRCVQCRGHADCFPGDSCDPLSGTCAPSCTTAGECSGDRALCDQARGICVQCIEDAHCRTDYSTPFCVIGQCVECFTSQQCPSEAPFCDSFVCRECRDDWHCEDGAHCDRGRCEFD